MMLIHLANIPGILIALQCVIFFIILITDNGQKRRSNRILAVFLLTLGIQFLEITMEDVAGRSFLSWSYCLYGFLYGPLIFFYVKSKIYELVDLKPTDWLHLSPFLLFIVVEVTGYSFCATMGPVFYVSLFLYVGLGIREIILYRRVINQTQSSPALTNLTWLQWFMIIFCLVLILDIFDQFISDIDFLQGISPIHLTILFLINWISYKGFKDPQIFFMGISEADKEVLLSQKEVKEISQQDKNNFEFIKQKVEENRLYANSELTLQELSDVVGFSTKQISYLINSVSEKNFMTFINDYRLEEAARLLSNPEDKQETVNEVMYRVGFNSKSSFYTLFKKRTGLTPSAFKSRKSVN